MFQLRAIIWDLLFRSPCKMRFIRLKPNRSHKPLVVKKQQRKFWNTRCNPKNINEALFLFFYSVFFFASSMKVYLVFGIYEVLTGIIKSKENENEKQLAHFTKMLGTIQASQNCSCFFPSMNVCWLLVSYGEKTLNDHEMHMYSNSKV